MLSDGRRTAGALILYVISCLVPTVLLVASQGLATSARDNERLAGVIVQFKNPVLVGAPFSTGAVDISYETISDARLLQALIESRARVIRPVFCASLPVNKQSLAWFSPRFKNTYVVTCASATDVPDCIARLYQEPSVVYAEPNELTITPLSCQAPNDSLLAPGQNQPYEWWITGTPTHPDAKIRIEEAWRNACSGDSVTVGLFDCGFAESHEDIVPRCVEHGTDYDPGYGHGTWVMGILGANADNEHGIAGIARNHRIEAFSFPNGPDTTAEEYADSIMSAVDTWHCDVLGTSAAISGARYDTEHITINKAIAYAFYSGVPFVASSGNDALSCIYAPASFDEVIAVGGQDSTGGLWEGATPGVPRYNHGRLLDLIAPSVWMITTNAPSGYYLTTAGTSFAQPIVTGTIALMKSIRGGLPAEDYIGSLQASALDVSSAGYDTLTGWGRINAGRAVANLNRRGRYRLVHGLAVGATADADSQQCKALVFGCEDYGIQDGTILRVRRFSMRREVAWPDSAGFVMSDSIFAWGLSDGTNGIRAVEPKVGVWNAQEGRFWNRPMCYVDYATVDSSGATLVAYYYKLLDDSYNVVAVIGPSDPDTATFAYGAIGPFMRAFRGSVSSDTTLSGPVWVSGDIVVASGATLTIAAGSHLYVAPSDNGHSGADTTSCEIIVNGGLKVMGSSWSRVRIESNAVLKAAGDWRGISIGSDADSVIMRYCDVRYADIGLEVVGGGVDIRHCTTDSCGVGVKVNNGNAMIKDVMARYCQDKGFYAFADSGVARAVFDSCRAEYNVYGFYFGVGSDSCRIRNHSMALNNGLRGVVSRSSMLIGPEVWCEGNDQDGVVLISAGSDAIVNGVTCINNTCIGCYCDSSSNPEVKNCYFSGNYDNIASKHSSLPILGDDVSGIGMVNAVLNPTRYHVVNYWSGHTVKAEECYWGAVEEGQLPMVSVSGSVDLNPWLDSDPGFSWRMLSYGGAAWASTNYPNPFNPQTRIDYCVGIAGDRVRIRIYDIAGRLIRTLVDENKSAGQHSVLWDGRNSSERPMGAGLYFARMQIGPRFEKMQKMMLVK